MPDDESREQTRPDHSSGDTVYVVRCEDCDLLEVCDPKDPPSIEISYWGSIGKAVQNWSAKSAAKGKRDGHRASAFRDYDEGLRHRPHIEETSRPVDTETEQEGSMDG